MNKKGFTVIELLAVITVLAVLGVIVVPLIGEVISDNKEKLYDTQIDNIKGAVSNYVSSNVFSIDIENGESVGLHLSFLKSQGYIDSELANPLTGEEFDDNLVIIISNNAGVYSYTVCTDDVQCDTNIDFLDS